MATEVVTTVLRQGMLQDDTAGGDIMRHGIIHRGDGDMATIIAGGSGFQIIQGIIIVAGAALRFTADNTTLHSRKLASNSTGNGT